MKAIKIGNRVEIYNDTVSTFDGLPAGVYAVRFAAMSGFYLEECADIVSGEEKIYGSLHEKAKKVFGTYERIERNLGVILSGDKGIGKSLFARLLAENAVKRGMPVIVVDRHINGIAQYLEGIEQEALILFDEFDKTFGRIKPRDGEAQPQTELLGLFDGISHGRKLFVITCNEIKGLDDCIVNRPGRFHYHFRFDYPSESEIREYLADKLDESRYGEIDTIVGFSHKVDLNYDCLRSIVLEVNGGENFKSAINDLNILNLAQDRYDLTLCFENGAVVSAREAEIDFFSESEQTVCVSEDNYNEIINVHFYTRDCEYDIQNKCAFVTASKLRLTYDEDYDSGLVEKMKALVPAVLTIRKVRSRDLHYAL